MSGAFFLNLFCFVWYIWSMCGFCDRYLQGRRIKKTMFVSVILLGQYVVWLNEQTGTPYICAALLSHCVWTGTMMFSFRDETVKKAAAAVFLITIQTFVWNFSCSFFSLFPVCIYLITDGRFGGIDADLDLAIAAVGFVMVVLVFQIWKKPLASVFAHRSKSWYLFLSIPLALLVTVADLVDWGASNGILVVADARGASYGNIYYNQLFSHLAVCLFSFLAFCIVCGFVFGMNKIDREQRQKEQYRMQTAFYKMMNEQYVKMEQLRHDMKNHILSLYGLLQEGAYESLETYLKKMLENGNIKANEEATGNKGIDALLYYKRKQAEQNNVRWECDVCIPRHCGVDLFDLCILLGNSIDNALQACLEMPDPQNTFVSIQVQQVKRCLLIVVKNSTVKKQEKEIQKGTGLFNINETVHKYDGTMQLKVKDHIFEIALLLPMQRTDMTGNRLFKTFF
ncbi:MAG: GHKL domain-containing protein [Eubacterium sp.]|nr:GHKL domain-containing protein [Eubacterium sp.]